MDESCQAFISQYLNAYQPYKSYWNYEDGCVLKGCVDLYAATGDPAYRDYVLQYLYRVVDESGTIINYESGKYNIDSINCGKVLFFALDETGEQRWRKALDFLNGRLEKHPRCACGNFWHKEIYPEQIWLDGLYMAQPFRVLYDMRFGGKQALRDIVNQFRNVRRYCWVPEKELYVHACDVARTQPWADPQTGKSPNFWLRSMGWYLMALVDCIGDMDEQLYEHRRALEDLFLEAVHGILRWQDPETGLFWQVIDRGDVPENYLETSGSAMVLYALMKGVRLGILDEEKYLNGARQAFACLNRLKLRQDPDGSWHLWDICKVAGLGPGSQRDGSVAYYLSEPRVPDDAKGVGPWMMALAEYLRGD